MRALCMVLVLLFSHACARAPEAEPSELRVEHERAGAWVDKLRAAHANADTATTAEARADALHQLRTLAAQAAPASVAADDAASMRRDLYGRAARLALTLGRAPDARELIERGLSLEGRDPFHTQLLVLAVETHRALGDEAAAREAERAARAALTDR